MNTTDNPAATTADVTDIAAQRAAWNAQMRDYDHLWERYRERQAAALPQNKTAIFDAMEAAGIVRVVIEFEGSGDSGQMEHATAFDGNNESVPIPGMTIGVHAVDFDAAKDGIMEASLRDAIEIIAYELLERTHGGWEDNDGGYGEFAFDAANRSITLDFNERYVDTTKSVHEF